MTSLVSTPDVTTIDALRRHYAAGGSVAAVVAEVRRRIVEHDDPALFIGPLSPHLDDRVAELDDLSDRSDYALFGIPFVVKDNIDVAGVATTAGFPPFSQPATASAEVIQHLHDAGAILIGKVNLDQFATGLVGTRSPYGTPVNPLDASIVPGGSSSGSAVAVAAGIVPFALGTDTAGSGRVPATMNQIVGLKPTRGVVSTVGVIPACASLDCVSVFATTVADAWEVFTVVDSPGDDPWQREERPGVPLVRGDRLRVGVPGGNALAGVDPGVVASYRRVVDSLLAGGGQEVEIDLTPFLGAGEWLYGGPFVAERVAAVGEWAAAHPNEVVEPTRSILREATSHTAVDYHRAQSAIRSQQRATAPIWRRVDVIVLPTVPEVPTLDEVKADPLGVNARLGRFTTFANLLDLAVLTIPDPDPTSRAPGLGASLYGPAGADARLAALGAALLTNDSLDNPAPSYRAEGCIDLVVVGAHLEGQALNHQLTDRGATLVTATSTAPSYRLWALPDGLRPALEPVGTGGRSIEVEVWSIPAVELGTFVAGVAPPLAIGTVTLIDGSTCLGFVCELHGLTGATDISSTGGWRAYRSGRG